MPVSSSAVSRRAALAGAAGACLLAAGVSGGRPGTDSRTTSWAHAADLDPRSVSSVETDQYVVALTFDDGPDPAYTPAILDHLRKAGVRATFFMIGRAAEQHRSLVRRVRDEGHVIANHTADHLWLDTLAPDDVADQVRRGGALLTGAGAANTKLFRPPRGLTSPTVARVTQSLDVRSYFWGTCLEANHPQRDIHEAAELTASHCHPGTIILAHDGGHLDGPNPQRIDRSATVAALPLLLARVHEAGLGFVTMPDLMAMGQA